MKNKGFTLIELLSVIVILAVLATITTVLMGGVLSDSKESLSKTQINNIENAAETYYLKEGMQKNVECVNISDLLDKGYIEGTIVKDIKTKDAMNGSVTITYQANQYNYKYQNKTCE